MIILKKLISVMFMTFVLFLTLIYAAGNNYIAQGSLGSAISGSDRDSSGDEDEEDTEDYDVEDEPEDSEDDSVDEEESSDSSMDDSKDSEDSSDDSKETFVTETIVNENGARMERTTKTERNEVQITESTYDANGNLIKEERREKNGVEEEIEAITYDTLGNKLAKYEIKTRDGKVLKVELDEEGDSGIEVKYNVNNQTLTIRHAEEDTIEDAIGVSIDGDNFKISKQGFDVLSGYSMNVDEATGELAITTSFGDVILSALPDLVTYDVLDEELLDVVDDVYLKENEDDNSLNYVLEGTKSEKFLGVFGVEVYSKVYYSAKTGLFVKTEQPFFTKLLDLFSF